MHHMHRIQKKVNANVENSLYGLQLPNVSHSEHQHGAQKLVDQQTSTVDDHVNDEAVTS